MELRLHLDEAECNHSNPYGLDSSPLSRGSGLRTKWRNVVRKMLCTFDRMPRKDATREPINQRHGMIEQLAGCSSCHWECAGRKASGNGATPADCLIAESWDTNVRCSRPQMRTRFRPTSQPVLLHGCDCHQLKAAYACCSR